MIIAVDAMGGDFAPGPVVAGAARAVAEHGSRVVLVGDQDILQSEIKTQGFGHLALPIKHCTKVVGMDEAASVALRKKKDSSIRVAFDLVKHGEAMAVV
ncbi:MAG: phosphate--acyl-ACP acyltransferase, partial [Candidatus Methylomirabilis sp.]|nr:phosphate--acyl-ACP acyltransferase [Deltaproteobacteria bacterium]